MTILSRLAMLLRTGWRSLGRNKGRTLLTMLGIIIGVAAVIAMVAMGNGARLRVESEVASIGDNTIEVDPAETQQNGVVKSRPSLHESDAEEMKDACPSVRYVSAMAWNGTQQLQYKSGNSAAEVIGVGPDFFAIHSYRIAIGNVFTDEDVRNGARVCVLGAKTADVLFGNRDPIGRVVRVKSVGFKAVGVKAFKGTSGGWMRDEDSLFLAPYTSVMRYVQRSNSIGEITVAATGPEHMLEAKEEIRVFLRQHHHIHGHLPDDFEMEDVGVWLDKWKSQQAVFAALLGGVASISLLVGGIGIMNIMLVTVTERIREIGTRMAIGATPTDIMLQFLIEALTVSLTGGVLGIVLGVLIAHAVDRKWSAAQVSVDSVVLSFVVSCAIGVFFGFYPAWKASRLDPIDALRHE